MQIDFNKVPKLVFDASQFGVNKHFIVMMISTGMQAQVFALVPEDAKNLRNAMNKTLDLYEQTYGKIPDSNASIPSPIDLSKPPTGDTAI